MGPTAIAIAVGSSFGGGGRRVVFLLRGVGGGLSLPVARGVPWRARAADFHIPLAKGACHGLGTCGLASYGRSGGRGLRADVPWGVVPRGGAGAAGGAEARSDSRAQGGGCGLS